MWRRCCASRATRSPPTPAPPRPPSASSSKRTCSPTGSRRWSRRRRSAWGSTSPTWGSSCTSAPRRRRSPTTSRSAAPAGPPASAEVVLLPGREDQDVWRYFASVAFPSEAMVRNVIEALEPDRPQSTPALEPLVDLGRTRLEMVLKVLDVDGAVRRVKGGWIGTGEPWTYDEERYRKPRRGPQARAAGDARLPGHRRVPDGVPAQPARRSGARPTASGAAGATTAPAARHDADVDAEAARGHPAAADAARAWRSRRANSGLRAGQARRGAVRADHRRARSRGA